MGFVGGGGLGILVGALEGIAMIVVEDGLAFAQLKTQ